MKTHYRNNISLANFLLFSSLFVTTLSARSVIRQYTDDTNTNLQQGSGAGAGPSSDLVEEARYLDKHQEVFSRDHKVSASNTVKGLRDRLPSTYSLKMESFNTLLKSTVTEKYESRPFSAAGYNWNLVVYPTGNKKDNGAGYLSLYVSIDNSALSPSQEVIVDLKFYVFNKNEKKYFTIQDTDVWRFTYYKTMWGFSQVLPIDTFKDTGNGYLYDGDHCEFGVDVTTPAAFDKSELFSVTENFYDPRYTWTITGFSTLFKDTYYSDVFTIGGRTWNIQVDPSGRSTAQGQYLSMYLNLGLNEQFRPYEKIFVRAKLRVLNQRQLSNLERGIEHWYSGPAYSSGYSWGYHDFISLADLRDSSKGYLVNDMLKVQVELETISSTKYFPA